MSPMPAAEGETICRRLLADAAIDPRLELTIIGALAYMVGIQGRAEEAAALIAKGRSITSDYDATWLFRVLIAFYGAWLTQAGGGGTRSPPRL